MKSKINKITLAKAGNGAISPKLSIPWKWIQGIEITEEEREVKISYDEKKKRIIITKK